MTGLWKNVRDPTPSARRGKKQQKRRSFWELLLPTIPKVFFFCLGDFMHCPFVHTPPRWLGTGILEAELPELFRAP